jgi:ElaB/YqjD/DUF883 family membrane-anchored ribosome-binding protein
MNTTISKFTDKLDADEIFENVGHSLDEISNKVVETGTELSEKTLSTIKKYPLHTALVAGAVGLIAGAIVSRK